MGRSNTMAAFYNEIIKKAEENKKNGVPDAHNDMLEELRKKLSESGEIFLNESILWAPKIYEILNLETKDQKDKKD